MSRSFKSKFHFNNDILDQRRWNHIFRTTERIRLRSFGFKADSTPSCPGCEICDEWPNYGNHEGYITTIKYDIESRHGMKNGYAGRKKVRI